MNGHDVIRCAQVRTLRDYVMLAQAGFNVVAHSASTPEVPLDSHSHPIIDNYLLKFVLIETKCVAGRGYRIVRGSAGMSDIVPIIMPKWGLLMTEGTVTTWWKKVGEAFKEGEDLVDVETSKIANGYEAPFGGRLVRIVAQEGDVVAVGGLIAVSAESEVSDEDIDAFVASFQSNFVPTSEDEADDGGLKIETVTVGARDYRVGLLGDRAGRRPVVLIHGFSGDLDNWLFNLEALIAHAPIVALELPGHGASTKDVAHGSLADLAQSMTAVMAALSIDEADLVGHSLGAAVAMRMALDNPALVRSLVLLAPAGLPGTAVSKQFADGVIEAQSARQLVPSLQMLFADDGLATREMADEMMKFKRLDGVDEALAKIAGHMLDGDDFKQLADRLSDLPPTTVVIGAADRVVGQPDQSKLPASWRIAELASGHMPHMEQATEVNAIIVKSIAGDSAK